MPVAIRKRSWEEHVTHPSGLQYSYDDLDLVCCHGVDSEGPWLGAGASKQGRRTRCASMPEGCHRMPTEDMARTVEVTASVVNDEPKPLESNVKVPLDFQEESAHGSHELVDVDIPQRASELEHLQTANIRNSGEFHCNSNSGMSTANISLATDSRSLSEIPINGEGEVGTESIRDPEICNNDCVFKSPHISCEEQQCISISSNNGPPLSESAGDQPGKLPNHQETKESHTEGYSRPPEISEAALNQSSSAAGLEPQTDLADVEEEAISTSGHADSRLTLPVGLLHSSGNMMESGEVMPQVNTTVEPVGTLVAKKVSEEGAHESCSKDSANKLDGLKGPETLNENTGLKHDSRDIQDEKQDHHGSTEVLDQAHDCEKSYQTSVKQHNVEMAAMDRPKGEESAQAVSSEKTEARNGPTSSDICLQGQLCSLTANNNMPSAKLDDGYSEENPAQSQSADLREQTTTSVSQLTENTDEILVSKDLACPEEQVIAQQLENSCSKLDPIPEVSHVEPDDTHASDPQKNSDFTQSPDVQHTQTSGKHEQHLENLLPCSAEVIDEPSPEGHHGNQEASGCYLSDSPASEVTDGQREHHRPVAAVSRMEETDEEAQAVICSDTQLSSPVLDGTNEPGDQKDDGVVKVRMRKVRM
uniref:uncharacterized protein n=1 Tax=Semicossyphus pulcher TaxID=241346 RepID=UPI0037E927E4